MAVDPFRRTAQTRRGFLDGQAFIRQILSAFDGGIVRATRALPELRQLCSNRGEHRWCIGRVKISNRGYEVLKAHRV